MQRFRVGSSLSFGCRVFGAQTTGASSPPDVQVEVRLYRDGSRVFAGQPIPLAAEAGETALYVVGKVKIPPDFAPGEYRMELLAYDRVAGRRTSQWADLTLLGPELSQ